MCRFLVGAEDDGGFSAMGERGDEFLAVVPYTIIYRHHRILPPLTLEKRLISTVFPKNVDGHVSERCATTTTTAYKASSPRWQ